MSGIQVSKSDLAHIFGVDQPTIEEWIRLGMPYMRRRKRVNGSSSFDRELVFDTADTINWRMTVTNGQTEW